MSRAYRGVTPCDPFRPFCLLCPFCLCTGKRKNYKKQAKHLREMLRVRNVAGVRDSRDGEGGEGRETHPLPDAKGEGFRGSDCSQFLVYAARRGRGSVTQNEGKSRKGTHVERTCPCT